MKRLSALILLLATAVPAVARTQREEFNIPCSTLCKAVRDAVRNSGKYGIIGINDEEMTTSYNIGGWLSGKRTNSVILNPHGDGCEMQIQTTFSGIEHDDAGDFKTRVYASLAKMGNAPQSPPPVQPK